MSCSSTASRRAKRRGRKRCGSPTCGRTSFTLKTNPLQRGALDEFVTCYHADNRHERKATWSDANSQGRWRPYDYDDIVKRDKCSLDIFWLKDESLEDSSKLPDPHVLAAEIAEDLRSALEQIESVLGDLQQRAGVVDRDV